MKFNENPSSGSRVVPCGQLDMTNLTVAFHYFANAPKHGFPVLRNKLLSLCEKLVQHRRAGTVSVICIIIDLYIGYLGPGVAWWLRRCATSRTVLGSIPGGVTVDFSVTHSF
jgi:hypothetical protein